MSCNRQLTFIYSEDKMRWDYCTYSGIIGCWPYMLLLDSINFTNFYKVLSSLTPPFGPVWEMFGTLPFCESSNLYLDLTLSNVWEG